jgi:pimeloyl-ACP methyl ester carboxylesterase
VRGQSKPRIGGVLAALALAAAVLIAVGIGYEQVERQGDRQRFPQIGRSVDVGGRALNFFCSGDGSPSVILESDALSPGFSGVYIQKKVAGFTRACWYDRAGYGWSDPGPSPHTSRVSAADLHELLRRSGLEPPYVLVGDGFGTLNVRVYCGLYPGDVAGMVLVDPIDESGEGIGIAGRVPFHLGYPPDLLLQTVNRIGLMRLLPRNRPHLVPRGLTPDEQVTLSGLERQPKMRAAFLAERGFTDSLSEVRMAGGPGDRPLTLLRSEDSLGSSPGLETQISTLAHSSGQGREVVVKDSGHHVQSEAPDAVVEAIRSQVETLRRNRKP